MQEPISKIRIYSVTQWIYNVMNADLYTTNPAKHSMRARTIPRMTKTCPRHFFRGRQLFWWERKARQERRRARREARRRRELPTVVRSSAGTSCWLSSPRPPRRPLSGYWASHCYPWCWPCCRCDFPLQRGHSFLEGQLLLDLSASWGSLSWERAEMLKDQRLLESTHAASSSSLHPFSRFWNPPIERLCWHDIEFLCQLEAEQLQRKWKGFDLERHYDEAFLLWGRRTTNT